VEPQIIYNLGVIPDWVTAVAAVAAIVSAILAFSDFNARNRPYIDFDIDHVINDNKEWHFFASVINKGQYPVFTTITKAILKVGDVKYPSMFEQEVVVFPGQEKKTKHHLGYISEKGRELIKDSKYIENTVTLEIELASRKINEKKYKYKTYALLQIMVGGDEPGFKVIKMTFN
jgi:hypothetical protein